MVSLNEDALSGAELTLLHAKHKLSTGTHLTLTEKLGAMGASFAEQRSQYGPVPADAKPVDVPLPESVKGAITNARS